MIIGAMGLRATNWMAAEEALTPSGSTVRWPQATSWSSRHSRSAPEACGNSLSTIYVRLMTQCRVPDKAPRRFLLAVCIFMLAKRASTTFREWHADCWDEKQEPTGRGHSKCTCGSLPQRGSHCSEASFF